MIQLSLQSDGSENVPYRSAAFPLHMSTCSLSMYPGMRCISHWHGDYEFCVVHTGRLVYRVNGVPVTVSAGEGLYVAPRAVHSVEAISGEDCQYLCVVFPVALLSASGPLTQRIQAHLTAHGAARCQHLLPSVPVHREVILGLLRLRQYAGGDSPDAQLRCVGTLYQLLADLGNAIQGDGALPDTDCSLSQIKDMIRYIHLHADRKLTLSDIAHAGSLSRSSCESAFQRVLHTSPIRYLTDCRLEKGMGLLASTPLSVTEIAHCCGFCSASYFAEQLRRRCGYTPGDYRKRRRSAAEPDLPAAP